MSYQYFTWVTTPWKSVYFILNQTLKGSVSHRNAQRKLKQKPLTRQLGKQVLTPPWLLLSSGLASSHAMATATATATRAWGWSPVPYWRLSGAGHGGTCLPAWGTALITPSNHFSYLSPNGKHCLNQGCTVGVRDSAGPGVLCKGGGKGASGLCAPSGWGLRVWAEEKMAWLLKSSAAAFKGSKEGKKLSSEGGHP